MESTRKYVSRNSKKAFTLVELVVVIAILAVLAAIAIPTIIGIINSASKSQVDTDAASIDAAVKEFHAGVTSGMIHSGNLPSSVSVVGTFPAAGGGNSVKNSYANNTATLKQAMQYAGIWDKLNVGLEGGNFGYADGDVVAAVDGDGNAISSTAAGSAITVITGSTAGDTTIGTIMKR